MMPTLNIIHRKLFDSGVIHLKLKILPYFGLVTDHIYLKNCPDMIQRFFYYYYYYFGSCGNFRF